MLRDYQKMELLEKLCENEVVQAILKKNKSEYDITEQDIDNLVSNKKLRILIENAERDSFEKLQKALELCELSLNTLNHTIRQHKDWNENWQYDVSAILTKEEESKIKEAYKIINKEV